MLALVCPWILGSEGVYMCTYVSCAVVCLRFASLLCVYDKFSKHRYWEILVCVVVSLRGCALVFVYVCGVVVVYWCDRVANRGVCGVCGVDCAALRTMLGFGGCFVFGGVRFVCVLRCHHCGVWCGVCRFLHDNDITSIGLGAFEGLGSLSWLCAHQWCGENSAVWGMV